MTNNGRVPFSALPIFLSLLFAVTLLASGCSGSLRASDGQVELDSLRAINGRLAGEIRLLSDSLSIAMDIESGQYFRDYRALQNSTLQLQYQLKVCEDGGRVLATELVDNLFAPATAVLSTNGKKRLDEILTTLGDVLSSGELRIHGHGDTSKPGAAMSKTYPTNWELSAARATAIARHIIETYEVAPDRIAAVSFGDARPVESNLTSEGRKINRRIEIVIL